MTGQNHRGIRIALGLMLLVPACKRQQTPAKLPEAASVNSSSAAAAELATEPKKPATQSEQPVLPDGHPPISPTQPVPTKRQADQDGGEWQGPGVSWTVPAGWELNRGSGMRFATLKPTTPPGDPEIAVSHFPGDVGGMLANVNRWRRQIGLSPISADQLSDYTKPFKVGDLSATLVELTSAGGDKRCIVVSIPHAGQTWFVKMTGAADAVDRRQDEFLAFGRSIRLEAALPPGHP